MLEEIEFIIPHDDETDSEGLTLPSYHARIDRYKSYLEKQKEQKPVDIAPNQFDGITYGMQGYSTENPAEWSEEDERKRNGLIKGLEDRMGFGWASDPFSREEYIAWLKSLRPQPHWKPSEEQMKALCSKLPVVKGGGDKVQDILETLYDDLKKL